MAVSIAIPWHEGEHKMHQLLKVPDDDNPTSSMLTPFANMILQRSPLLAVGIVDEDGWPWTAVWGGEAGFAGALGPSMIGVVGQVDGRYDPVVKELMKGVERDGIVGQGRVEKMMVGGLAIDLMARKRVKLYGRMLTGKLVPDDENSKQHATGEEKAVLLQLAVRIEQSLGNCPKYLNQKHIMPHTPSPSIIGTSLSQPKVLGPEAIALIAKSDLFFISTSNGLKDMDTNHRGGPVGFVRSTTTEIIYPEYSGNRLYQSLGNLQTTPRAGLVFPDFETGDVLYVTGSAEVLVGDDASAVLTRSKLAVRITVHKHLFVRNGLSFRGEAAKPSPYNPRVRLLVSEQQQGLSAASKSSAPDQTATLIRKTAITPSINRYRFRVSSQPESAPSSSAPPALAYKPGQWVALDFSSELDIGYSHMRDDDPTSLNDDFVRTFTVSSAPPPPSAQASNGLPSSARDEFELTIRDTGGPVTSFLSLQDPRAGLRVPIIGFGGEFTIPVFTPAAAVTASVTTATVVSSPTSTTDPDISTAKLTDVVFIAGGVGITPLLAHLPMLLPPSTPSTSEEPTPPTLTLLWTLRTTDLPLAQDVLNSFPALAKVSSLFITGSPVPDTSMNQQEKSHEEDVMKRLERAGARVVKRRITEADVLGVENEGEGEDEQADEPEPEPRKDDTITVPAGAGVDGETVAAAAMPDDAAAAIPSTSSRPHETSERKRGTKGNRRFIYFVCASPR